MVKKKRTKVYCWSLGTDGWGWEDEGTCVYLLAVHSQSQMFTLGRLIILKHLGECAPVHQEP